MELRLRKIGHKKAFADYTGLIFGLALIFALAIFFIVLSYAYGKIEPKMNQALTSSTNVDANANVTKILNSTSSALISFDALFPLLLIGIFGFVLISSLFVRSHPAFFFIGLIILGVVLILAAIYSNVYETITANPNFEDAADDFDIMGIMLENLTVIMFVLFILIAWIIYVKQPIGGNI